MSTAEHENPAADQAAEDEFDQAFNEFAGGSSAEDLTQDNEPDTDPAPQAADESDGDSDSGGDSGNADPAPASLDDLKRQLEEARNAARDFEHRFKSEVGRQTAYQRQIQELRQQLQNPPAQAGQQRELSARMKAIADDFPELATAFQEELQDAVGRVRSEVDQHLQPIRQREQEAYLRSEESRVREAYPDFTDTVRSTEFQTWFSQQPEAVRSLAGSPLAQDALAVLDYYTGGQRFQQQAGSSPVKDVQARRQSALQKHTSVRSSAPAPVTDAPDDFESAFNYYAKRLGK